MLKVQSIGLRREAEYRLERRSRVSRGAELIGWGREAEFPASRVNRLEQRSKAPEGQQSFRYSTKLLLFNEEPLLIESPRVFIKEADCARTA